MGKRIDAKLEIIDDLRRVFQAINEYSKAAEKVTGLTGPQLWAIKLLADTAPLRVSDLARQMYLHPATVVGIVDRLELKGMVARNRSIHDRRAIELTLTENGKKIAAKSPEVAQGLLVKGLDRLSQEEFSHIEKGMKLVVSLLGAENIKPQPMHVKRQL